MTRVALTIDTEHPDRPARPGNVERILDTLAATGTRATFFVQGRWAEAYPGLARRIAAEGHLVGNHGRAHVSLRLLSRRRDPRERPRRGGGDSRGHRCRSATMVPLTARRRHR